MANILAYNNLVKITLTKSFTGPSLIFEVKACSLLNISSPRHVLQTRVLLFARVQSSSFLFLYRPTGTVLYLASSETFGQKTFGRRSSVRSFWFLVDKFNVG